MRETKSVLEHDRLFYECFTLSFRHHVTHRFEGLHVRVLREMRFLALYERVAIVIIEIVETVPIRAVDD